MIFKISLMVLYEDNKYECILAQQHYLHNDNDILFVYCMFLSNMQKGQELLCDLTKCCHLCSTAISPGEKRVIYRV